MTSVRRALALSFAERYLTTLLALASNIILARLLTPAEIGLYSVTLAVIGIAQVLRDFGIGNYLIQERELRESHVRTAFGVSLLLGALLFCGVFAVAPFTADFYGDARMTQTMRIASLNFLVLPFCVVPLALLRREMRFARLLQLSLAASAASFVVTVALAWAGWGADSMAIGSVALNIVTAGLAWLDPAAGRRLRPALSEWRAVFRFGGQSALANVVTSVSMDINDLALGKILGFAPVAILSRAQGLIQLFNRDLMGAVRNVAYPSFANAHRDGAPLERHYIASVAAVTAVGWPFFAFLSLFPLEILRILYGPQWDAAAPLVPWLAAAAISYAASSLVMNAVMAVGRIDLVTRTELLFQPLRAALIVGAALVYQTLLACVIAYLVAFVIYTPLVYWVKSRCVRNEWRELFIGLRRSAAVAIASSAVPALISFSQDFSRSEPISIGWFAGAAMSAAGSWVLSLALFRHPLADEPAFRRALNRLRLDSRPGSI